MPTYSQQLSPRLLLESSEPSTQSKNRSEFTSYLDTPFPFSSTSVPRVMANFDFQFGGLQPDQELVSQPGDLPGSFAPGGQVDDVFQPNFHYQLGQTPALEASYWQHATLPNEIPPRPQPSDNQYTATQSAVPSHYPINTWAQHLPSSAINHASTSGSQYAADPYSPPGSSHSHSFHQFSNVQASPGSRRSRSSELIQSPYTSSSHLSPPPTTPSLTYGVALTEDPSHTLSLDGHREQLKLFKDALKLPLSFPAGPFVPQKMYIPHTNSDRRRYVEEIELQGPIYFWMHEPEECGIPLIDALHSRVRRLQSRDEAVFEGRGPSISVRIQWPGYRPWSRQIPTKDFRSPPQPITRAKLAKNIAKCVERFLVARAGSPLEDDVDQRWKVGGRQNEIKLEDLILVSMHHVSMGSWQPHLRLRRPFPAY